MDSGLINAADPGSKLSPQAKIVNFEFRGFILKQLTFIYICSSSAWADSLDVVFSNETLTWFIYARLTDMPISESASLPPKTGATVMCFQLVFLMIIHDMRADEIIPVLRLSLL